MGLKVKTQPVHRPGPLKQSNKRHKGGKSSSKLVKGKVGVKAFSHANKSSLHRRDRRHQASQIRKNKRAAVIAKKRNIGSLSSPPILVAVIPLGNVHHPSAFLQKLKDSDDGIEISYNDFGHCYVNFLQQKQRFIFCIPRFDDIHAVMDATKVAERILFIHSAENFDDYTELLLSVILAHAVPSTVHILPGLDGLSIKKKSELKKEVSKKIESRFPDEKLFHADTKQELNLLLRHLGCQKERSIGFKDARPHLLGDKIEFIAGSSAERTGSLRVSGYLRGQPLNVNSLVHIPGWGDFQMSQIDYENDPHSTVLKRKSTSAESTVPQDEVMAGDPMQSDIADPDLRESLQSEAISDLALNEEKKLSDTEPRVPRHTRKIIKKVLRGTSDYQAAWIIGNDVEGDSDSESDSDSDQESDGESMVTANESIHDEEENMETENSESEEEDNEFELAQDDNESLGSYDKDIDMEEEKKMLVRFREERIEHMFPDEEDTPVDIPARIKYQKYRGLKSFRDSEWDPKENTPLNYARIFQFDNFRVAQKRVLSVDAEGAVPGLYVTVHIVNVPQSLYDGITKDQILIIYGLLQHEQKMTVVNTVIKKHPSCKVPIKSKDSLIFHIGFRRFVCRPIFSVHSGGAKFKYEKFLPNSNAVVASFFAPITFPPISVVVFRQQSNGQVELVATGSLMNADPNRVIIKRIVLSGHPFRIFRRSAVVRYMFFNREDIESFKGIELRTRCGRKGHIKEALGSHGHMKCVFDRQLRSQDSVLMFLYKRVFPKWAYETTVPTPVSPYEDNQMKLFD